MKFKVGQKLFAKNTVRMDKPFPGRPICLYKNKQYIIKRINYNDKQIIINSEIETNHYFNFEHVSEFFITVSKYRSQKLKRILDEINN